MENEARKLFFQTKYEQDSKILNLSEVGCG